MFEASALAFFDCTTHKHTLHICPPLQHLLFWIRLWSYFHNNLPVHGVRSLCNQFCTQHSSSVTAVPLAVAFS